MADSPEGTQTAPAAEAPVSVFDEARAAIATTDTPAPTAPDAAKPDATEPDDTAQAPEEESAKADEPKGTRRERGEDAYKRGLEEGRKAVEAERAARAEADAAEAKAKAERESLATLIQKAKEGDWEAAQQLAAIEEGRLQATDTQARELTLLRSAEEKVFKAIAADFASLKGHEGIDDDGFKELVEAPSVAAYGKKAFELGQKSRAGEITTLQTQVRELSAKLAARGPSPISANGHTANGAANYANLSPMRRAFEEAKAEQGAH